MAVELGAGYVSVVPAWDGGSTKAQKQLGGKDLGKGVGTDFLGGFKGLAVAGGIAAVGAAVGVVFAKGFSDAVGQEAANDKLAAQLGLPEDEAKRLGSIAGSIYAGAYGESIGEVNEAIKSVLQSGIVPEDIGDDALQKVTEKAINLGATFDQEVGRPAEAAGQLIRTGLADNAEQAFDILTRGFQEGADKAGDLLDTYREYSTMFRDIGITGEQATGLFIQGLRAGARDTDTVADALKEFAIRGQDASVLSAEGFKLIGLNAKEMTKAVAKGGPEAADALDQVLDSLRNTADPVKRNAAAVALFGTKAEDLGDALFALDPSEAERRLGNVTGAAERLGDTLGDNTATRIESFKRGALQGLTDFIGGTVLPGLETLGDGFGTIGDIFQAEGIEGIGRRIEENAPILGAKLANLGSQLYGWVQPQIEPMLGKLGELLGAAQVWFFEQGLPLLAEGVGILIPALTDWIVDDALPGLIDRAPEFIEGFVEWMDDEMFPAMEQGGKDAAAALVSGFIEGLKDNFDALHPFGKGNELHIPGTPWDFELAGGGTAHAGEIGWVGEHGPELFAPGVTGTVIPHRQSMAMLAPSAAGAGGPTLNVYPLPGENVIDAGMRALKWHSQTQLALAG